MSHPRDVCFNLDERFQSKQMNIFPHGPILKLFHLRWRSGLADIIWKVHHPRTIHAIFALNWLTGFREKHDFFSLKGPLDRGQDHRKQL